MLSLIKDGLFISEEDLQFIPIYFDAFRSSANSEGLTQDISDFFKNTGNYYVQQMQSLLEKKLVDKYINPSALGRALTCMLDGLLLHKGLFELSEKQYRDMINETISLYRCGLS